jgi:hypothetical protein
MWTKSMRSLLQRPSVRRPASDRQPLRILDIMKAGLLSRWIANAMDVYRRGGRLETFRIKHFMSCLVLQGAQERSDQARGAAGDPLRGQGRQVKQRRGRAAATLATQHAGGHGLPVRTAPRAPSCCWGWGWCWRPPCWPGRPGWSGPGATSRRRRRLRSRRTLLGTAGWWEHALLLTI